MTNISRILIANRGEIACRIMRTVQNMAMQAIAVYSDADEAAPHVKMADQAICIGSGHVDQSYLVIENIIDAAKKSGADAIHPGYGFLSENAEFARACADNDIVFIGPRPEAIEIMGNKAAAKEKMIEAGVPCVPGYNGKDQSLGAFAKAADDIGFPIMVKASAGGGGRGMRLVNSKDGLPDAINLARSEAENAFGNGHLILEKAIINPSHIEIQVFGDTHGNIVHYGERDCSVQRRHQKILEEAPSLAVDGALREKMGEAAINAAKCVDYVGAGTVEFLLDADKNFYFLEMNTRLQVEHPVSEIAYDEDFVRLQIEIASGNTIGKGQDYIWHHDWAIEARLYCEDPENQFLPAIGMIDFWRAPSGEGVRVDAGITTGIEVSPFYDPMVAKIIGFGETRDIARRKLLKALKETCLFGPKSNLSFLIASIEKETFKYGPITTAFIDEEFEGGLAHNDGSLGDIYAVAAVIEHELNTIDHESPLKNWTSAGALTSRSQYKIGEDIVDIFVHANGPSNYTVTIGDTSNDFEVDSFGANDAVLTINGKRINAAYHRMGEGDFWLNIDGITQRFQNLVYQPSQATVGQKGGNITAPMHGVLLEVKVNIGEEVQEGQSLAVLEAMKMQHEIKAEINGTVKAVGASAGSQVAADSLLIEIEPAKD
ncbi:biotin carboxylase N-terminal domain-containing protein [Kordiimonas sp. SCSIO 12610]|uniref:acetyl/propionyl/methylcrotonyl-CoA carboxylase subunit alpha n=1 Tax=Kordiimonas sp. SCSIO 12610 TaxID=2829597 RepID=UPI00210EC604|nr:biotin carboxylase N-terminal domain-containing protein [Kordiimonas sp. SCSIO 12610]UTW54764.1 ATP-grasp domain-containing protein [Kordiimonas sp. SCSIO 12610]